MGDKRHIADGQDYYDSILESCRPENPLESRIKFLEGRVEELAAENVDLRRQLGIKTRVYHPHLGTMCEE